MFLTNSTKSGLIFDENVTKEVTPMHKFSNVSKYDFAICQLPVKQCK